jgi:hypothetical protein
MAKPKRKTWNDLPIHANRCARKAGIPDSAPVYETLCVECKRPMWTRDEKMENLCEGCEYILKEKVDQMRVDRRNAATDKLVVPSGAGGDNFINPIRGGGGGLF